MDTYISHNTGTDLFSGGGEMGLLMRTFDWASTSLGPVEGWPSSLRAALGILLRSRYPMFLWWGPDLIQFYNDSYRPSLGHDKHPSALGQPGRECWKEIWPVIGPLVEGVLAGGESSWSEDQFIPITRSGYLEEVHWTYSYSAVPEEDGTIGGVLVVCSETTGRVRAERRLRMLEGIRGDTIDAKTPEVVAALAARHLAENAADLPFALLYFVTPDGSHLRLAESVGLPPATSASPLLVDLTEETGDPWELKRILATGESVFIEEATSRFGPLPGGIWDAPATSALVLPVSRSGQTSPTCVLIAGISPGQSFDASYRQFLELVASALASALANVQAYQDAQERAQALADLDRAKTTFFSNISHEFRTPLTLSLGPLEALLSEQQAPLLPEQRPFVEMVHRNTLRQLKLVNALLDFARIEAGRADAVYVPTNLAQLTSEVASAFQSTLEQAGLSLLVECPPLPEPVYVDPDLWEKIVLNLLSNAFKFTFEGFIRLALTPTRTGVELVVEDSGIGMREEDASHLFERFYRAHAALARTREGSGIGLALVQELVRLHGGNIRVQSTEGKGTTFTISIPWGYSHLPAEHLAKRDPQTITPLATAAFVEEALRWLPEAEPSLPESLSKAHQMLPFSLHEKLYRTDKQSVILVVDDSADMREYLKRLLNSSYQVICAAEGRAALSLAREIHPDVILSDVMMPGLDGFALLRALRDDPLTATIPVILLSARAGEEATLEGLQAGANDYLIKPFSPREVLARVQAQLEMTRLRREAELAREYLHALLMQAPAIICVLRGPEHVYELANSLYYELMGQRDLLGKPIRQALPELEGQGIYELLDQVYSTGEPFYGSEIRVDLHRRSEEPLEEGYFNFIYQPVRGVLGTVEGIMVLAVEVTEQVRARQRMGTFLGIASHELKNPLTSIKGNVDLAQRRVNKALTQMALDGPLHETLTAISLMLTRARQQIDFQNRLVSDLVDTTRIQAEKLELRMTSTNVGQVVREAVEEQRQLAPTRQICLQEDVDDGKLWVNADADRIRQVVINYLSNALKYSDDVHPVLVRVETLATEVRVSVQDKGPGLSQEEQAHIWERFYRSPDAQVKSGTGIGLGLGLHICQTIIEQHKGRVGVESQPGQGSTFWFLLPCTNQKNPSLSPFSPL